MQIVLLGLSRISGNISSHSTRKHSTEKRNKQVKISQGKDTQQLTGMTK